MLTAVSLCTHQYVDDIHTYVTYLHLYKGGEDITRLSAYGKQECADVAIASAPRYHFAGMHDCIGLYA